MLCQSNIQSTAQHTIDAQTRERSDSKLSPIRILRIRMQTVYTVHKATQAMAFCMSTSTQSLHTSIFNTRTPSQPVHNFCPTVQVSPIFLFAAFIIHGVQASAFRLPLKPHVVFTMDHHPRGCDCVALS